MAEEAVQAALEEELLAAPTRGSADELLDAGAADHFGRMRHSAAHVMAEAVMRLFPGVKLGIGPAITDGFYYDFLLERPLTPEDLASIEAEMAKSIAANHTFMLDEHAFDDARAKLVKLDQTFKVEIMDDLATKAAAAGQPKPNVTTYTHGEFQDLCRGRMWRAPARSARTSSSPLLARIGAARAIGRCCSASTGPHGIRKMSLTSSFGVATR